MSSTLFRLIENCGEHAQSADFQPVRATTPECLDFTRTGDRREQYFTVSPADLSPLAEPVPQFAQRSLSATKIIK